MKEISPIAIWINGSIVYAHTFQFFVINDNLKDTAIFYYGLYSGYITDIPIDSPIPQTQNLGILLSSGNITMSGTDYATYESSPTSNDFAYSWGASQLNLTLI